MIITKPLSYYGQQTTIKVEHTKRNNKGQVWKLNGEYTTIEQISKALSYPSVYVLRRRITNVGQHRAFTEPFQ